MPWPKSKPFTLDETVVAFWSKVNKKGPSDCWEWTGAKDGHGYGRFRFGGVSALSHRVSWLIENGAIPRHKPHVLHRCDNPPCCNPAHLFIGTPSDNIHDAAEKKRLIYGIANIRKTHCVNGHPYDEKRDANGKRKCSACMNERKRLKRKEAAAAPAGP